MDDVFATHTDFESQWTFIEEHLLPRLDWAKLKLTFKKIRIGCSEIVAVEIVHRTHGRLAIKPDRVAKIGEWPIPVDQRECERSWEVWVPVNGGSSTCRRSHDR